MPGRYDHRLGVEIGKDVLDGCRSLKCIDIQVVGATPVRICTRDPSIILRATRENFRIQAAETPIPLLAGLCPSGVLTPLSQDLCEDDFELGYTQYVGMICPFDYSTGT
jgi:hypothetical protein